jgi:hypothetical protein
VTFASPKQLEPEPEGLVVTVQSVGVDDPPLTYKRVVDGRSATVVTAPLEDGTFEVSARCLFRVTVERPPRVRSRSRAAASRSPRVRRPRTDAAARLASAFHRRRPEEWATVHGAVATA